MKKEIIKTVLSFISTFLAVKLALKKSDVFLNTDKIGEISYKNHKYIID